MAPVSHQLTRVLRIREVLEEVAKLDFERKNGEARQLEMGADRQRNLALGTRAEALRMLSEGENAGRGAWLMRIADAELLARRAAGLRALAEAGLPEVNAAREQLMERRTDRLQVESLLASAARAEEKEQIRREQNRIDDWFQSRSFGKDRD
jgi:hypothetical protein